MGEGMAIAAVGVGSSIGTSHVTPAKSVEY